MNAQEIIADLTAQGYSKKDIKDAMLDGQYLFDADIDQDTAEEIYDICR